MTIVIWVLEIVVLLVFVGVGGFPGFIAWAILSALVLFAQYANRQTQLKAAELVMQAERDKQKHLPVPQQDQPVLTRALAAPRPASPGDLPSHLWCPEVRESPPPPSLTAPLEVRWPLTLREDGSPVFAAANFRTMMVNESHMLRRVSASQWDMKLDADYRKFRIDSLREVLEGIDRRFALRVERAKQGIIPAAAVPNQKDDDTRASVEERLEALRPEPTWNPLPERFVAAIETAYQRYLSVRG